MLANIFFILDNDICTLSCIFVSIEFLMIILKFYIRKDEEIYLYDFKNCF